MYFFFFKQKTAYDMLISDWSSDVCSSDLEAAADQRAFGSEPAAAVGVVDDVRHAVVVADHHHHVARDVDQVADLQPGGRLHALVAAVAGVEGEAVQRRADALRTGVARQLHAEAAVDLGYEAAAVAGAVGVPPAIALAEELEGLADQVGVGQRQVVGGYVSGARSEEHTSELQSLMRISYA